MNPNTVNARDIATIDYAFHRLFTDFAKSFPSVIEWETINEQQALLFAMTRFYHAQTLKLEGLKGRASTDWKELNRFLVGENMAEAFEGPFDGIGAVSVLDKLVKWAKADQTSLVNIFARNHNSYPGFKLPVGGVSLYTIEGLQGYLIRPHTVGSDHLWIWHSYEGALLDVEDLELVKVCTQLSHAAKKEVDAYDLGLSGVELPMVDFDTGMVDIPWLLRAKIKGTDWFVAQAKQQVKFRMDQTGARGKAGSAVQMSKGGMDPVLTVNREFLAYFTAGLNPGMMPLIPMRIGYDGWRKPEGSLDDL